MDDILKAIEGTEFNEINTSVSIILSNVLKILVNTSEEVLNQGVIIENVSYNNDGQVSEVKRILNPACKFLTDSLRELKLNFTSFNIDRRSQLKLFEQQEENITASQIMSDLRRNGETLWQ